MSCQTIAQRCSTKPPSPAHTLHRYNKFSLDITDALKLRTSQACRDSPELDLTADLNSHHKHKKSHGGHCQANVEHTIVVRAWDPADTQRITIGKQRLFPPRHPAGIFYTSTSGIWQTVWLEPVRLPCSVVCTEVSPQWLQPCAFDLDTISRELHILLHVSTCVTEASSWHWHCDLRHLAGCVARASAHALHAIVSECRVWSVF